jgi:hypothetical protein
VTGDRRLEAADHRSMSSATIILTRNRASLCANVHSLLASVHHVTSGSDPHDHSLRTRAARATASALFRS